MSAHSNWSVEAVEELLSGSFNDLLARAHQVHREHFDPNSVQLSTLLSIKTGGCPEDCAYCPQSARHPDHDSQNQPLMDEAEVLAAARQAREQGATRFCMGAAWRSPKDRDLERVARMVSGVKALGLETCATLGMLRPEQAHRLAEAGLDFYNHNLDSSPEFYQTIIGTRTYQDRLDTLQAARGAGLKLCCGGILGMGESRRDRAGLLAQLAAIDPPPESVPINLLVQVPGTPLHGREPLDVFEFVRTLAAARVVLPNAYLRLSAGRSGMSDELHALCFFAGANSIFYGEQLLTTGNPEVARDRALFERLGLSPEVRAQPLPEAACETSVAGEALY